MRNLIAILVATILVVGCASTKPCPPNKVEYITVKEIVPVPCDIPELPDKPILYTANPDVLIEACKDYRQCLELLMLDFKELMRVHLQERALLEALLAKEPGFSPVPSPEP